jgi:hypothetical protein
MEFAPFGLSPSAWLRMAVSAVVLVFAIVALLALRRRPMDEISRFLWSVLIVFAPVVGPAVFFIVRPETVAPETRKTI